ncbi:hypothetical protein TWF706_009831 [Orbilia oligospora]|nr:hypothetical protein TWF706_009831 [Orbilia oligospora]
MTNCRHSAFLDFGFGDVSDNLLVTDRLQRLGNKLNDPSSQSPCLAVWFTSQTGRPQVLKRILPFIDQNGVQIHLASGYETHQSPLLFAEFNNQRIGVQKHAEYRCHRTKSQPIQWQFKSGDLLCIYGPDFGGWSGVEQWLSKLCLGRRRSMPKIFVFYDPDTDFHTGVLGIQSRMPNLSIYAVELQKRRVSPKKTWARIYEECLAFQQLRLLERKRFTFQHWAFLFEDSCLQFGSTPAESNLIRSSRRQRPLSDSFSQNLIKLWAHLCDAVQAASVLTASSLVLDSFPPGMHGTL